jgi:hypothetical protein
VIKHSYFQVGNLTEDLSLVIEVVAVIATVFYPTKAY